MGGFLATTSLHEMSIERASGTHGEEEKTWLAVAAAMQMCSSLRPVLHLGVCATEFGSIFAH